jgi:hypothetical protein
MEEYRMRKTALYASTPKMHLAGGGGEVVVARRARGRGGGGVSDGVGPFRDLFSPDCARGIVGSSSSSRVARRRTGSTARSKVRHGSVSRSTSKPK